MFIIGILIYIAMTAIYYKQCITSLYLQRIGLLIFALTGVISFNTLIIQPIGSGMGIYNSLFQVTTLTQFFDFFISILAFLILLVWPQNPLYYYKKEIQPLLEKSYSINTNHENQKEAGIEIILNPHQYQSLNVISIQHFPREYGLITLMSLLGSSLLISSSDLISLYLSLELQSFALYILASIYRNSEDALSASLKYFLLGSLSSCFILLGCSLIYSYTGMTSLDSIISLLYVFNNPSLQHSILLALVFIFIGFFFKVGAAPLHHWSPDVYDQSPSIITLWLTIMPKLALIIFIFGLYLDLGHPSLTPFFSYLKNLILIISILSLIIGSTVGLTQIKIKRLLAYSTISHLGFIFLAFAINTEQSIESFIFYLIQYSITNLNIFLIIIALGLIFNSYPLAKLPNLTHLYSDVKNMSNDNINGNENDIQYIKELQGIFFENPILSLSLSICFFSMAGI